MANCPFHALATDHTDLVCGLNLELLTALTDGLGCPDLQAVLDPAPTRCCVVRGGPPAPPPPDRQAVGEDDGVTWLLTGGAGYIGAHVVRSLQAAGHGVVVVDDLSSGVTPQAARRRDPRRGGRVRHRDARTHDDGEPASPASCTSPRRRRSASRWNARLHYYRENVDGALALAEAMVQAGVRDVVYSSSAAVYGSVDVDLITEDTATVPASPYGATKLVGEWVFREAALGPRAVGTWRCATSTSPAPARPSSATPARSTWCRWRCGR